jgi:hypothetical protein
MVWRFRAYAHDTYERGETVEWLMSSVSMPKHIAEAYAKDNAPLYEVGADVEFDDETGACRITKLTANGQTFVPSDD